MNEVLLFFLTVVMGLSLYDKISRKSFGIFLGFELGVVYFSLIPLWLLLVRQSPSIAGTLIHGISWSSARAEVSVILSMLLAYELFSLIFGSKIDSSLQSAQVKKVRRRRAGNLAVNIWILCALHIAFACILFMASGLGLADSHWATTKREFATESNVVALTLMNLLSAGRFLLIIATCAHWVREKLAYISLLPAMLAAAVDLYATGNRIFILQLLVALSTTALYHRYLRFLVPLALVAGPFGYAMLLFSAVRSRMHSWSEYSLSGALNALSRAVDSARVTYGDGLGLTGYLSGVSESSNLNVFVTIVRVFPDQQGYLLGHTLVRPFVFWIPRQIWPAKPFAFQSIIGESFVGEGVSLNSTFFGECYANFGVAGVLFVPVYLFLYSKLLSTIKSSDKNLGMSNDLVRAALAVVGFSLMRNGMVVTLLAAIPAIVFLQYVEIRPGTFRRGHNRNKNTVASTASCG